MAINLNVILSAKNHLFFYSLVYQKNILCFNSPYYFRTISLIGVIKLLLNIIISISRFLHMFMSKLLQLFLCHEMSIDFY